MSAAAPAISPAPPATMEDLLAEVALLRDLVSKTAGLVEDARLRREGLIGYEGLRSRLAIDGRPLCLRQVKTLAAAHRGVLRPVKLGHRLVGFRPARVEAFLEALEGGEKPGGLQL